MLAPAGNYDLICFQAISNKNFNPSLRKEAEELLERLRAFVTKGEDIKTQLDKVLPKAFNLRIKAAKWFTEEKREIEISQHFDEIASKIDKIHNNTKLTTLAENISFAFRCNQRVVESVLNRETEFVPTLKTNIDKLTGVTYNQFNTSLLYALPNKLAQKMVDWVNNSLYIELITLISITIYEEDLEVSPLVVDELSFLIADAAQTYVAIAIETGFIKAGKSSNDNISAFPDEKFEEEQKNLADAGLEDIKDLFE